MTEDVFHRTLEEAVEDAIEAPLLEPETFGEPNQYPSAKIKSEGMRASTLSLVPQHGGVEVHDQDPHDTGETAR